MTGFYLFDQNGNKLGLHSNAEGDIVIRDGHDQAVSDGQIWYCQCFQRLTGAGTKKYFLIDIPRMENHPEDTFDMHIHWEIRANAEFELRIYGQPEITSHGTLVNVRNQNVRHVNDTKYIKFYEDPVLSGIVQANAIYADVVGSTKNNEAGHNFAGEFIVPGPLHYAMEIEKVASGEHWLSWYFYFSEDYDRTKTVHAITTTTSTTTTTV